MQITEYTCQLFQYKLLGPDIFYPTNVLGVGYRIFLKVCWIILDY